MATFAADLDNSSDVASTIASSDALVSSSWATDSRSPDTVSSSSAARAASPVRLMPEELWFMSSPSRRSLSSRRSSSSRSTLSSSDLALSSSPRAASLSSVRPDASFLSPSTTPFRDSLFSASSAFCFSTWARRCLRRVIFAASLFFSSFLFSSSLSRSAIASFAFASSTSRLDSSSDTRSSISATARSFDLASSFIVATSRTSSFDGALAEEPFPPLSLMSLAISSFNFWLVTSSRTILGSEPTAAALPDDPEPDDLRRSFSDLSASISPLRSSSSAMNASTSAWRSAFSFFSLLPSAPLTPPPFAKSPHSSSSTLVSSSSLASFASLRSARRLTTRYASCCIAATSVVDSLPSLVIEWPEESRFGVGALRDVATVAPESAAPWDLDLRCCLPGTARPAIPLADGGLIFISLSSSWLAPTSCGLLPLADGLLLLRRERFEPSMTLFSPPPSWPVVRDEGDTPGGVALPPLVVVRTLLPTLG